MIDEALEFLHLRRAHFRKPQPNGHGPAAARPFITADDIHDLAKPTEDLIRQYPAAALATAFLVGVAIAWWIKRK
jgi:hypothetical protein